MGNSTNYRLLKEMYSTSTTTSKTSITNSFYRERQFYSEECNKIIKNIKSFILL